MLLEALTNIDLGLRKSKDEDKAKPIIFLFFSSFNETKKYYFILEVV